MTNLLEISIQEGYPLLVEGRLLNENAQGWRNRRVQFVGVNVLDFDVVITICREEETSLLMRTLSLSLSLYLALYERGKKRERVSE